jgi:hypothetical protein
MWWLLVVGVVLVAVPVVGLIAMRRKGQSSVTDDLDDTFKFSPPL